VACATAAATRRAAMRSDSPTEVRLERDHTSQQPDLAVGGLVTSEVRPYHQAPRPDGRSSASSPPARWCTGSRTPPVQSPSAALAELQHALQAPAPASPGPPPPYQRTADSQVAVAVLRRDVTPSRRNTTTTSVDATGRRATIATHSRFADRCRGESKSSDAVLSGRYSHGVTSSDDVLSLVRQALDEFDDRPLAVSVRRAVRIASLTGDSRTAVRLAPVFR